MIRAIRLTLSPLLILPFLLLSQVAFAENGGIMGKVAERSTGKPVVGARISLSQTTTLVRGGKGVSEIQGSADSDLNGNYVLNDIPSGSYVMLIQTDTYSPSYQKNVQVAAGQTLSLDVALDPKH